MDPQLLGLLFLMLIVSLISAPQPRNFLPPFDTCLLPHGHVLVMDHLDELENLLTFVKDWKIDHEGPPLGSGPEPLSHSEKLATHEIGAMKKDGNACHNREVYRCGESPP